MYKTIFVEAERNNTSKLSTDFSMNGDHLARDIQAAILENLSMGYLLDNMQALTSSKFGASYTQGMVLVFRKKQEK